jgi:hypothetical protein
MTLNNEDDESTHLVPFESTDVREAKLVELLYSLWEGAWWYQMNYVIQDACGSSIVHIVISQGPIDTQRCSDGLYETEMEQVETMSLSFP